MTERELRRRISATIKGTSSPLAESTNPAHHHDFPPGTVEAVKKICSKLADHIEKRYPLRPTQEEDALSKGVLGEPSLLEQWTEDLYRLSVSDPFVRKCEDSILALFNSAIPAELRKYVRGEDPTLDISLRFALIETIGNFFAARSGAPNLAATTASQGAQHLLDSIFSAMMEEEIPEEEEEIPEEEEVESEEDFLGVAGVPPPGWTPPPLPSYPIPPRVMTALVFTFLATAEHIERTYSPPIPLDEDDDDIEAWAWKMSRNIRSVNDPVVDRGARAAGVLFMSVLPDELRREVSPLMRGSYWYEFLHSQFVHRACSAGTHESNPPWSRAGAEFGVELFQEELVKHLIRRARSSDLGRS